jgi:hypothetical protein
MTLFDPKTTSEDVITTADKLSDIVVNSGLSAHVLHSMFSFYAVQCMNDIIGAAKEERLKRGAAE